MIRVSAVLSVWGEKFSPAEAERLAGIVFSTKNEPGEPGVRGRYAGKPRPYGSADLEASDAEQAAAAARRALLDHVWLKKVATVIPPCRLAGATDVELHLDIAHDGQCNVNFSPEEMRSLAELGIPLTLSCFEGSEGPRMTN